MTVNWLPRPPGSFSRLGVVTSRRLGPAVLRNRARRLLREAYRLHQDELIQPVDLVLIARPSILGRRLTDVERDLLGVLRRESLLKKCP
jgi:ribonuclease P protein component